MKKVLLFIFVSMFILSLTSATSCNPSSIFKSITVGGTPPSETVTCSTDDFSSFIEKEGAFFSTNQSLVAGIPSNSSITFIINFNQMNDVGLQSGRISFSGLPQQLSVKVNVTSNVIPPNQNDCQLNPSIIIYTQNVQQSVEFELPKITFSPTNCNGELSITSVYVTGGITTNEGMKPVYIKSSSSKDILLAVNTKGLSSITYNTKLTVVAFGKTFQELSSINIVITGGTDPNSIFDLSKLPVCSLSSLTLNLNNTYNLICTGLSSDVTIEPVVDNDYIRGMGVEQSATQFTWKFSAKKFGVSTVKAMFKYRGVQVGDMFSADVKINPGGQFQVGSTNIKVEWFQQNIKKSQNEVGIGETVLLPCDNLSNSLLSVYDIFINGNKINNNTFTFEAEKVYDIRVTSVNLGYTDLVISNFTVNKNQLSFSIDPVKDVYEGGDLISVNCSELNCSILLDNVVVNNPFYISSGTRIIKVAKENYISFEKNLTVIEPISLTACTPMYQDWKLGSKVICDINKNATIIVLNPKGEIVTSASGNRFEFKIDSIGIWTIKGNEKIITTINIEKSSWFGWLSFTNIKEHWIISSIVGIILLVIIFIVIKKMKGEGSDKTPPYEFKV